MPDSDDATVIKLLTEAIYQACHSGIIVIFDDMLQNAIKRKREQLLNQKMRIKDGHTTGALIYFQQEIQRKCKKEGDLEKTIEELSKLLNTDCPFKEMLKKIIIMQVHLVSRTRITDTNSITIDEPSMESFCDNLICKCGCVFFHNVESYYQCYQKKNYKSIYDIITEIVNKILSKYTNKAYNIFFSERQKSSSEILDDALNSSIKQSHDTEDEVIKEINLSDEDMKKNLSDDEKSVSEKSQEDKSDENRKDLSFMIQSQPKDTEDDEYHVNSNKDPDELMSQF